MKTAPRPRLGSPVSFALEKKGAVARLPNATADAKYICPGCGAPVCFVPDKRLGRFFHVRRGACPLDTWEGSQAFAVERLRSHLEAVLKREAHFPWLSAACACGLPAFRDLRGTFNRVEVDDPGHAWGVGFHLHSDDVEPNGRRVTVIVLASQEGLVLLQQEPPLKRWIALRPADVLSSPGYWALEHLASGPNFDVQGVKVPTCPLCDAKEK